MFLYDILRFNNISDIYSIFLILSEYDFCLRYIFFSRKMLLYYVFMYFMLCIYIFMTYIKH